MPNESIPSTLLPRISPFSPLHHYSDSVHTTVSKDKTRQRLLATMGLSWLTQATTSCK